MSRKFNELKIMILEHMDIGQTLTSKELSEALGVSVANAQMCLLRLRRTGCVDYSKERFFGGRGRRPYTYSVNDRGLAKLEFYRSRE